MNVFNLSEVMSREPDMAEENGEAMFWALGPFNAGHAWIGKYKGESPWTCHPDGDAFLQTLEGEVSIRLLTEGGERNLVSGPGSVFIIPVGTWHKYVCGDWATQFGAMVGATRHSTAEDPRIE